MDKSMHSNGANVLGPVEKTSPEAEARRCVEDEIQEKNETLECSAEAKSLGERVRKEVRHRWGQVGDEMFDEMFDEDDSAEVQILEEEDIIRGTRGVGALWKLALCATVSFATYILLSGPRFEPNWIPNISERDPVPKIYRSRNRKK